LFLNILHAMRKTNFTALLMQWHRDTNRREMPWKGEKDPYKIWLSEIILQQTRVEQGWGYYQRFIAKYPTVLHLAKANDEAVFKLWEGLGYYNRCKNLLFTAREIATKYNGLFPTNYDTILLLKGIGPYTAAAIASFAFNLPYAVVDGNVFRVLSRVFGIETAIDSADGKNEFTALANAVLDQASPGAYNQAIMDFGATQCKPMAPLCSTCLLQKNCVAFKLGKVNLLPFKEKVLLKKNRWFYYFLFEHHQKILIHKRSGKDIWENLHEFYLLEASEQIKWNQTLVAQWLQEQFNLTDAHLLDLSTVLSQQLTHQQIKGQFIHVQLKTVPDSLKHYQWLSLQQLKKLAFPKFIHQYLVLPNTISWINPKNK